MRCNEEEGIFKKAHNSEHFISYVDERNQIAGKQRWECSKEEKLNHRE
uniref:Uncharacterized protein n=1 Tax=Rhizophora mucronata TaxID=61149 RepID=A0A2P2P8R6_RHIMU